MRSTKKSSSSRPVRSGPLSPRCARAPDASGERLLGALPTRKAVDLEEPPFARQAMAAGSWEVERVPAGSGALYAVVRRGESVAGGDPAMAVFLRRPSALLCAAALSALATPNRLTLKRTPVRRSPKRARLGYPLHDGGLHLGHLARSDGRSSPTSTPSPAWRQTRRPCPGAGGTGSRGLADPRPRPHAPAARPQVVPTPGGGGPAPPPPSRPTERDRRAYLKVSFQKRLQLRNGARDLGNEELTLCPREISEGLGTGQESAPGGRARYPAGGLQSGTPGLASLNPCRRHGGDPRDKVRGLG